MKRAYFVVGASGSGKSSIAEDLSRLLGPDFSIFDFDVIGVPAYADRKWRQRTTEIWLQKLLQEKNDVVLLGQMVLGELVACPSASKLGTLKVCFLDVTDIERIKRLKKRNTHGVDQHTLNWAAWLRVHHQDPQWQQHVIKEESWDGLHFDRWDTHTKWDQLASVYMVDTTHSTIPEVARKVAAWIEK